MILYEVSFSQYVSINPIVRRCRGLVRLLQLQSGREKTRKFEPLGKDCHEIHGLPKPYQRRKVSQVLFRIVQACQQPGTHTLF